MMLRSLAVVTYSMALAVVAQAQSRVQAPAPGGETAALATAEESMAFAEARQLAAAWRSGRDDWRNFATTFVRRRGLPGYRLGRVDFAGDSADSQMWRGQDPSRFFRRGACIAVLVPDGQDGNDNRKLFAVRGDGVLAWSHGAAGAGRDGEPYDLLGVLGAGGRADVHAFPLTPTRGRDGNLWQPQSMLRVRPIKVTVADEDGEPMPLCEVSCVPAEPQFAVDAALPAGCAKATFEGAASWSGLPARGMGFVVRLPGELQIEPRHVAVDGSRVRVTVSLAQVRAMRARANEFAAIATLKNISSAQAQCQASGVIDVDKDGKGEYGTFGELSGHQAIRDGGGKTITPPVLSRAFAGVDKDGIVTRSGYHFRIFLPQQDGKGVAEGGGRRKQVDADRAETLWCCYAWPVEEGKTGARTFVITQTGDVLVVAKGYSGKRRAPSVSAGYVSDKGMGERAAANRQGADGRQWQVVR